MPNPEKETRQKIVSIHSHGKPLMDDVDFGRIAELTDGFSGADMAVIANTAASIVLHRYLARYPEPEIVAKHVPEAEISGRDFMEAIEKIRSQHEMKKTEKMLSHFM